MLMLSFSGVIPLWTAWRMKALGKNPKLRWRCKIKLLTPMAASTCRLIARFTNANPRHSAQILEQFRPQRNMDAQGQIKLEQVFLCTMPRSRALAHHHNNG